MFIINITLFAFDQSQLHPSYFRFIVPKEQFMELNRRNEGGVVQEMVLPLKRKYTKRVEREKTENGILKVKIQPPSAKRRLK